jgi:hypothetical protein
MIEGNCGPLGPEDGTKGSFLTSLANQLVSGHLHAFPQVAICRFKVTSLQIYYSSLKMLYKLQFKATSLRSARSLVASHVV